ncbi:MAG: rRNA (guanosine2251-2-O)-methyltransferase [Frankiaceae bacterium]|jgi:23S rRNA (guanosine2251-2'-O)-methyltransferase|nr:rRNA (guanosine2251-2-O)-methyltransferase [Frankiaceae bacterium]
MPPKGRQSTAKKSTSPRKRVGTGGHGRDRLAGKKPTLPAEQRTNHPAKRRADHIAEVAEKRRPQPKDETKPELVTGRNSVFEALEAQVPATLLYLAIGIDRDERVTKSLKHATKNGIPIHEVSKMELDRLAGRGHVHQGLALQVPPYEYLHPDELLERAQQSGAPLIIALDGVTDTRNVGAIARSAAAFGAAGVLLPERRAAGVNAGAWKASAGAFARIPVARAVNLARTLKSYADAGMFVIGLDADGELPVHELQVATEPLVLVVGSEGKGLTKIVRDACSLVVSIPMAAGGTESLNASVAASIALYDVARRRATGAAARL